MHNKGKDANQSPVWRSYLWFLIGSLLAVFSFGNQAVPIAAWLFPIFIIRFLRNSPLIPGLLLALVAIIGAATVAIWPMLAIDQIPPPLRFAGGVMWGGRYFLPFMLDRLTNRRLRGFAGTLVFPLAWVTVEYLISLTREGSWGALAYTQYGNLPLMQVVCVTGIWGIAFLMTWFASIANWVWESGFARETVQLGLGSVGAVVALVLIFGGVRLALFAPHSKTVRVAAITKPEPFALFFNVRGNRESVCKNSEKEQQYFLEQSIKAARNGAKVVVWQEHAVFLLEEEEAGFVDKCRQMARREQIYLVMAYNTYPADFPARPWMNKLTGIDRSGTIAWQYRKSYPSLVLEPGLPPGDGQVPILQSSYGKIAAIICADQEHPALVRQAGQSGAFLLVVPSGGWKGVTPLHTRMAAFRAIENGCALIKPNGNGLSAAFDHQGRVLSTLNYYLTADENLMLSDVPRQAEKTFYARIGDSFAWLCMLALAAILARLLLARKTD